MKTTRAWIEAMRLRTLPVSTAGVLAGTGCACMAGRPQWGAATLCLIFAILAQVASNFANEYFDYRDGLDRPGREGPRRGVTEGDINPRGMKTATFATLAMACCVGLGLVAYGGWWLVPAGAGIALGALAYSAGPYPLSRHGLGEVAVIVFFGIVPVVLTCYVQVGTWLAITHDVWLCGLAIGLMGANILIVNNYRDLEDDKSVGKTTLAVIIGRPATAAIYLLDGLGAAALMWPLWDMLPTVAIAAPIVYILLHTILWTRLIKLRGHRLNPILGMTAMLMAIYALAFLIISLQASISSF